MLELGTANIPFENQQKIQPSLSPGTAVAAGQTVSAATTTQCSSPVSAVPCPSAPIHLVSQGHQHERHLSPLEQQQLPGKCVAARPGQIGLRGKAVRVSCPCRVQGPSHHQHSSRVGAGEELAVPGLQFPMLLSLWIWETG